MAADGGVWQRLEAALDARRGRPAAFWWRDDDAVDASPALDRLLEIAGERPIAIAVIPEGATERLAARLADTAAVTVLQHGWAHRNHAPPDERKVELGRHRPLPIITAELARGHARLEALFDRRFLPVLVPPWNRITPDLLPLLPSLGFVAWSADRPRDGYGGLPALHAGLDPIDKHAGGAAADALDRLATAFAAEAPVGLLTHHRVIDVPGWDFLNHLADMLRHHPGVDWRDAAGLLAERGREP
jgi:hypothetical protein